MTSWYAYLFLSFLWDKILYVKWLRTSSCWSYKLSYRHLDGENQSSHFNLVKMNSELVLVQLCTVNASSVMTSKMLKMIQEINLSTWLFCKLVFCIISGEAVLSCASQTPTDAGSWGTPVVVWLYVANIHIQLHMNYTSWRSSLSDIFKECVWNIQSHWSVKK